VKSSLRLKLLPKCPRKTRECSQGEYRSKKHTRHDVLEQECTRCRDFFLSLRSQVRTVRNA
jgi:hypothetical protein